MKILMIIKGATSEHTAVNDLFHKWTALKYETRVSGHMFNNSYILFGFMHLHYFFVFYKLLLDACHIYAKI